MAEVEVEEESEDVKQARLRLGFFRTMVTEEAELIAGADLCGILRTSGKIVNFPEASSEGITSLHDGATYQFYNAELMQYLACLFKNTFTRNNNQGNLELVSAYMMPGGYSGEPSLSGLVRPILFRTGMDVLNDFAVVKTVNTVYDEPGADPLTFEVYNTELIHEYFIGLNLNSLRQYVTNFMFVYAIFGCVPSKVDLELCSGVEGRQKNHLLVEN
ncbi:MAG: hypothetical protein ACMG6E_06600, partial [Candidatus Roizmanbacteria bacterium]